MCNEPPEKISLEYLFNAALDGCEVSYRKFLQQISPVIHHWLVQMSHGNHLSAAFCEEVTQDVLLTVHQKRALFQRSEKVLPWIKAIARHRLIDAFRRGDFKLSRRCDDFETSNASDFPSDEASEGASMDLSVALSQLDEKKRMLVVDRQILGLSIEEMATKWKQSPSNIKISVFRSMQKLKRWAKK